MTIDPNWTSTIASIQASAALSPEKAEHQFGFLLSALGVYDVRIASRIASEIGLDKPNVDRSLSFAQETNVFLDCIAMKDKTDAQWDFYSYLKNYWPSKNEADPALLDVLGHRAGLSDDQNKEILQNLSNNTSMAAIRPLQVDTSIRIYGLPDNAVVKAIGYEANTNQEVDLKVNGSARSGFRVNVLNIELGYIRTDRIYGYNGAVWRGNYTVKFATPTNSTSSYTTFTDQFDLPNKGGTSRFPIGTVRNKSGELFLPTGPESLAWAADALTWARTNKINKFMISGMQSGNANDINAIKYKYIAARNDALTTRYYGEIHAAFVAHVKNNQTWSTRQIQTVFQSAARLSSLITGWGITSLDNPNRFLSPTKKSNAFLAQVQSILQLSVDNAQARRVSQALASALLSPNFDRLTREAKGFGKDTVKNALTILQAFDPAAAAAVVKARLMAASRGRYTDWLPNTQKPVDPDDYVTFLSRRFLVMKLQPTNITRDAIRDTALTAMGVYMFGAFRELAPNLGKIARTASEEKAIMKHMTDCMRLVDGEWRFNVPKYGSRSFEQSFAGLAEYIAAVHYQFSLFLSEENRRWLRDELGFINSRNLWGPAISIILRSSSLAVGWNVIKKEYKGFIVTRIIADVLCVTEYLEDNQNLFKNFAAVLRVRADRLQVQVNAARDAFRGMAAAGASAQVPQWALRVGEVTATYLSGAPLWRGIAKLGAAALEGVSKVASLGADIADVLYGTFNIANGIMECNSKNFRKGITLGVYGIINAVSGIIFIARGIGLISGRWFTTLRSVSFFLQTLATVSNIVLATVSGLDAKKA